MAKQIDKMLDISALAGRATVESVGPILSANGIDPERFIREFNERTQSMGGKTIACRISVYGDHSFDFEIGPPSTDPSRRG